MKQTTSSIQRRLAAILYADVAGYSRLMNADDVGTLRLLNSHREITDRQISQHGGRIANTAGDSILAEFASATEAVQAALDIQEQIAVVNEEVPEDRRVTFRIGIHVGEAMIRGGDLFGDGVNIAARMEGLAHPGSVCLSASAHEYAHRVLPLVVFEDLGPQLVKNLEMPIRAFMVRRSRQPSSRALQPIHRHNEFHLGRRFRTVLLHALVEVTQPEGLTPVEPAVFASLFDAPGIDERGLAARIGVDLGRVQRMVKHLKNRGLVIARPKEDDRRRHSLHLTPAGIELWQRLHPAILAASDRVMAPLSDSERVTLQDLMIRIIRANEFKVSGNAVPQ